MLQLTYQTASVPDYVLQNYKQYITDTELITLLHYQCVTETGKKAWVQVAANMGYDNLAPLTATINRLVEKKAITVDGYTIDASPLWATCQDEQSPSPTKPASNPDKTVTPETAIARETLDKIWHLTDKGNFHTWLATVKRVLRQLSPDEFVQFITYVDGYNTALQKSYKREFKDVVSVPMVNKYLGQWIAKGKPVQYTGLANKQKDFTGIGQ